MKNQQSLPKMDLPGIESESLAEWFSKNGKILAYTAGVFLLLLVIGLWMVYGVNARSSKDYVEMTTAYNSLVKEDQAALPKLKALLRRLPELQAKYDGLITQTLLNQGLTEEAQPFATRALERTASDNLPMYREFSETSLLIAQKQNDQALEKAQNLKKQMLEQIAQEKDRSFGKELFAFNLLQIGLLQNILGNKEGEATAWKEWKSYATGAASVKDAKIDKSTFEEIENQLHIGNITLGNYIETRLIVDK